MSGRYKAYGEYKESGVEWLGEIPGNWGYISISRMFTRIKRTGHIERELLSVYRDYGVIPKSSRDDNNNMPSEDLSPYQLVEINDLVMNKMKAWQGSIAISECEGIVSPAYFVYSPKLIFNDLALPKYIHYLLRNSIYITQYLSRSKGIRVNQWDLDPDEFKSIDVLLPTKEEQFQIAAFLDHETAKIDTLIDKQQQLIELLKEKRQAVISHAVTKGLDPDVPMKDSGVEWVNKIPHGWFTQKVRWSSHIYAGGTPSKTNLTYWENGTIPWINSGAVNQGMILEETTLITHSAYINSSAKWITKGSLVIALAGQGKTKGMVAQVGINTTCNQSMAAIVPWETERARYLFWWLNNNYENIRNMSGGDLRDGLNLEYIGDIHCPKPTHKECNSISLFLDHETAKIDKLIDLQLLQIELLKERRTALISAAVTGKIDVRDWQVPVTQTESDEVLA